MSDFVSDKLQTIDLEGGKWIKIPSAISFGEMQAFAIEENNFEQTLSMLVMVIKEWSFKDENDEVPKITKENIRKLNVKLVTEIQEHVMKIMPAVDKKKLENAQANSQKPSKEKDQTQPGSTS